MKTEVITTPTWETVRTYLAATRSAGVAYLCGQVIVGWQLSCLKEDHRRGTAGRRSVWTGESETEWAQILFAETSLTLTTSKRLIACYESVKLKLSKTAGGSVAAANTLATLSEKSPFELAAGEHENIREIILSLVDGETQKSLLYELKIARQRPTLAGGDTSAHRSPQTDEHEATQQLAFGFFGKTIQAVRKVTDPEFRALLAFLPIESDDPTLPSLAALEAETRASLAQILAVREEKEKALTPASNRRRP
jgi:hypothetical protein